MASKSAESIKYYVRQIRRLTWLIITLFVFFCVAMAIIWAVPKIWQYVIN